MAIAVGKYVDGLNLKGKEKTAKLKSLLNDVLLDSENLVPMQFKLNSSKGTTNQVLEGARRWTKWGRGDEAKKIDADYLEWLKDRQTVLIKYFKDTYGIVVK